jgi:hypothetical protein
MRLSKGGHRPPLALGGRCPPYTINDLEYVTYEHLTLLCGRGKGNNMEVGRRVGIAYQKLLVGSAHPHRALMVYFRERERRYERLFLLSHKCGDFRLLSLIPIPWLQPKIRSWTALLTPLQTRR